VGRRPSGSLIAYTLASYLRLWGWAMSLAAREVTRFLRRLRAVREFTPEPVSDAALRDILEVARWSGSASNRQPAEVVVVRDAAVKQVIAAGGARAAGAAPVALLVVLPEEPERALLDAFDNGRMVERILLAAQAHGLGGNVMTLKGDGPAAVARAVNLPPGRKLWTVVALGHTDEAARAARPLSAAGGRKPFADFVRWERY
jgi:nitroreductase